MWMKFGTPMQNDKFIRPRTESTNKQSEKKCLAHNMNWSKSKPEVEFEYGGRPFPKPKVVIT